MFRGIRNRFRALLLGSFFLLGGFLGGCQLLKSNEQTVQFRGSAQGTSYQLIYLSRKGRHYQAEIEQLLTEIDQSLSLYRRGSLIRRFNDSKRGVLMDTYMRKVVQKGMEVSRQSAGAFDLTVKPLVDLWGFGEERRTVVPDTGSISRLLPLVNYRLLSIKGDSLIKEDPGLRIDANGIAQGYTLDVIAAFLEGKGVQNYLVELGGELRVRGRNENGRRWRIGIEAPAGQVGEPATRVISLSGKGVSTSGNYRRFFESGGRHYAHTIDPRSGYPVQNGLISITVVAPDAITADAWDNALMVMGVEQAMEELHRLPGIEARFLYTTENGRLKDTCTAGFAAFYSVIME